MTKGFVVAASSLVIFNQFSMSPWMQNIKYSGNLRFSGTKFRFPSKLQLSLVEA